MTFAEENVAATAALLEEKAPQTCAAIWKQLAEPLDLQGTHAMWTGPEVSLQIPPDLAVEDLAKLPEENLTVFPPAGGVVWAYMPTHAFGGHPGPLYDIGVFYGPQARIFLPMGWVPCNHFADLEGDWEEFRAVCRRTRTEGTKPLRFERD